MSNKEKHRKNTKSKKEDNRGHEGKGYALEFTDDEGKEDPNKQKQSKRAQRSQKA
jgi:hypothetical protein